MRTYSEEEKLSHLELFKESGLSVNEYAREKDIPETTLRDWIKVDENVGFGKIDVKSMFGEKNAQPKIRKPTVFVNEKIRIELKEGYSKQFLRNIVEVLIND